MSTSRYEPGKALYDLVPSQKTMQYMLKYSLHKQVTNVPMSLALPEKIDFKLMQQAFTEEIKRNDCLRLRFTKQNKQVKQYFTDDVSFPEIEIKHFQSVEEQERFFDADACNPVRFLKGETIRAYFFTDALGKSGVYINACHLIMDAMAVSVFFKDLFSVYRALKNKTEMPAPLASFEAYLPTEYDYLNSKRYESDKAFLTDFHKSHNKPPYYAGVHGPEILERQQKRKKDPNYTVPVVFDPFRDKSAVANLNADEETTRKILAFCEEKGIAPELLIETGFKIHAGKINHNVTDTLMMVLCSRRATKMAQNMGGCLTQPLQMRTVFTKDMTFEEMLTKSNQIRNKLYRHMNFPYKDALEIEREIYHFTQAQGPALMMYTWLPIDGMLDYFGDSIDFRFYNLGRYILPLYTFTFRSIDRKHITFYYMYRTKFITEAHINALHENALKVINAGIDNPDITLSQLFDIL